MFLGIALVFAGSYVAFGLGVLCYATAALAWPTASGRRAQEIAVPVSAIAEGTPAA